MHKSLEEPYCWVVLMSPGRLAGVVIEQASCRELKLSGDLLWVPVECQMDVRGIQASFPPIHTSLCQDPFSLFFLINSRRYMRWKKNNLLCLFLAGHGQDFFDLVFILIGWMGGCGLNQYGRIDSSICHGNGGKRQAMRWMESEDEAEIEMLGLCWPNNISPSPTQPDTILGLGPFSLIPPPLCMPCQHWLRILCLFLLLTADLACPSCSQIVKNQHGLSLHIAHWCENKESNFTDHLLQWHQDHAKATSEESRRRLCLEAEELAERKQLKRVQDATRAQCIAAFESLAVSQVFYYT